MKAWLMLAGAWAAAVPLFASVEEAAAAPVPGSPEFQLDTTARADAFHATHDPVGPTDTLVWTAQVKALAKFGSDTSAKLEVRGSTPSSDGRDDNNGIESRALGAFVAQQFA